jgi:hypothetical protein
LSAVSFSASLRREVDGEEVEVMAGVWKGSRERGKKQVGARDEQTVNLLKEEVIGNTGCMKSSRDHQIGDAALDSSPCDASMQ